MSSWFHTIDIKTGIQRISISVPVIIEHEIEKSLHKSENMVLGKTSMASCHVVRLMDVDPVEDMLGL